MQPGRAGGRLGLLTAHWEHQLAYGKGEQWSSEQGVHQGWCLAVEQCSPLELLELLGSSTGLGKGASLPSTGYKAGVFTLEFDCHLSSSTVLWQLVPRLDEGCVL